MTATTLANFTAEFAIEQNATFGYHSLRRNGVEVAVLDADPKIAQTQASRWLESTWGVTGVEWRQADDYPTCVRWVSRVGVSA